MKKEFKTKLGWCVLIACLIVLRVQNWLMAANTTPTNSQPNIVLILSDDQTWTDFGFMGHPDIKTPHLDKLASESLLFPHGYVPTSLCRPSLATLISGLYPHQHGITGNDPPKGTNRSQMLKHITRMPKLPSMLAEKGYVSYQCGKWWEGTPAQGGFTSGMTFGDPQHNGRHGDEGLKIGRQGMKPIFNFLDSTEGKPFYLWYAPFLPHTPHNPPERLLKKYEQKGRPIEIAKYYAMCDWFDETCGELVGGLEDRGLRENTLIVFVTDNGWIQRTPQTKVPAQWRFKFAPKSKRSPHDGGLRTPIFLSWPGKIQPALSDTPISSIDIVPTMLAAAGISKPESMPGLNLLPSSNLEQQRKRSEGRENRPLFGEIFAHDVTDIDDPSQSLLYRWCRAEGWKLILPSDPNKPVELYCLTADPYEKVNLAQINPERVGDLKTLIEGWWDGNERDLR